MNTNHGFTLTELLVTMTIAAIVLGLGVPSYQNYIQNARITTGINQLVASLHHARSEALTRQQRVTVCRSSNGTSCLSGGGSGDWSRGWIMFADPNDPAGQVNDSDTVIRVMGPITGVASFIGNTNVVNRVTFSAQGLANGSNGTITLCDSRGATRAAAIVISFGGQIRLAQDTDNNGIVDSGGDTPEDISC